MSSSKDCCILTNKISLSCPPAKAKEAATITGNVHHLLTSSECPPFKSHAAPTATSNVLPLLVDQGGSPFRLNPVDGIKRIAILIPDSCVSPKKYCVSVRCHICHVSLSFVDLEDTIPCSSCKNHSHTKCLILWLEKCPTCPVCCQPFDDDILR